MMINKSRLGHLSGATPGAADAINSAAAKYGIPPNLLLAVATQESGLNQSAVSPAGAIGVMQLMPATAAQFGANPNDLDQNIDAGAHYLSNLLTQYNGDTALALAAYNAGPGNVARYGGIPPFPETENYVSSVMAAAGISSSNTATGIDSSGNPCDPSTDADCTATDGSTSAGVLGDNTALIIGVGLASLIGLYMVFGGRA